MSKLLIGTTELNVISCFAHEHVNGKRELKVTLLQSEITYDALKTLFKNEDGADIIHTEDNGTVTTYIGYKATVDITSTTTKEDVEVFVVVAKCVAEAERRALEAKAQAEVLTEKLKEKDAEIAFLKSQLLDVQLATVDLYEKSLAAQTNTESEVE